MPSLVQSTHSQTHLRPSATLSYIRSYLTPFIVKVYLTDEVVYGWHGWSSGVRQSCLHSIFNGAFHGQDALGQLPVSGWQFVPSLPLNAPALQVEISQPSVGLYWLGH